MKTREVLLSAWVRRCSLVWLILSHLSNDVYAFQQFAGIRTFPSRSTLLLNAIPANLNELSRTDLQAIAKQYGVKANGKTVDIIDHLEKRRLTLPAEPIAAPIKEDDQNTTPSNISDSKALESNLPRKISVGSALRAARDKKSKYSHENDEVTAKKLKEAGDEVTSESQKIQKSSETVNEEKIARENEKLDAKVVSETTRSIDHPTTANSPETSSPPLSWSLSNVLNS